MGALRQREAMCVLIYVRFDLVSSTFFKTGGRRKLQSVGRHMMPELKSLKSRVRCFFSYVCVSVLD